ncbi:hypothetical protein HUW62_13595 [Myxococcus sp. AM011]|uniref:hypothetical protein n=1 Tax=Myxococcus sp. AM011 TaxID=2745200 RepID=UPI0015954D71|nr:hypothetical protein [Myxococcus sp. AM011]NVJ22252.1 hypothetical protein [Myxococcus sp. AM011]
MRSALLALVLFATASTSCSATAGRSDPPTPEDFFRRPDRVQIFIADLVGPGERDETTPGNGYFVYAKEGPELSSRQRRALADIWKSPKDFVPYPERKCGFNPDIAFRFWIGKTFVDAVACFSCRMLMFRDAQGNPLPDAGFLDGFPVMQDLAKQSFPEGGFSAGW